MTDLHLVPAHGWVVAAVGASYIVHNLFMSIKVGAARKKYGVKYPTLYADETKGGEGAKTYNCIQRAQQNSFENLPSFYALLLVSGTRYPATAAIAAAVYLAGRLAYFAGYSTGDPSARQRGSFMYFGTLAMLGMIGRWAVELIRS